MKKFVAAIMVSVLCLWSIGVAGAEENPLAKNALPLLKIFCAAASEQEDRFDGVPSDSLAWNALTQYVNDYKYQTEPLFSEDEVAAFYAELFSVGTLSDLGSLPNAPVEKTADGYQFMIGDGDWAVTAAINDVIENEDGSMSVDLSSFYLGHSGQEYFRFNAIACLNPSDNAPFGATVSDFQVTERSQISFAHAQSTSALDPQSGNTYEAENSIDGNHSTCWAYPAAQVPTLTLRFERPTEIRGLVLTPGYAKSESAYRANCRAKVVELTLDDGTVRSFPLEDLDAYDFGSTKVLSLEGIHTVESISLQIVETYSGEKYDDMCISEIAAF